LDRNILGISTPTTAECTSSIYNSSEKTLFVGQTENFTEIPDQPLTIFGTSYQVNYYLPATTLEALSLDTNQIDYNTYYDSNSFDGIITATFNIYDYNISKSYDLNEYYFNVYLDGNCDYNIEDLVSIDLNLCSREDNRTYLCNYDFNIIQLNDDLNIEYSTYQFTIDVNNANLISSVDFNFDLTPEEEVIEEEEQNSGGGGSHSNSNSGSGAPSLQVNNPSINYQDNIDLLEISYLQKIQLFDNYHIPFEIINFDLNQDSNNFINDYNEILEKYSNLPELRVIERILISGNISLEAIDLINSNGYELSDENIKKYLTTIEVDAIKYYFIEILADIDSNELILDTSRVTGVIYSTSVIEYLGGTAYPVFSADSNYLVQESLMNNQEIRKPAVAVRKAVAKINDNVSQNNNLEDASNITKHKSSSNYLWIVLISVIIISCISVLFQKYIKKIKTH